MAQGFFGGINLSKLFAGSIVKAPDNKEWVCLTDLPDHIASPSKKGEYFVNIGVYVNDELDQFNNVAGITLSQTLAQREAQEKKVYIGNLKYAQVKQVAAAAPTPAQQQQSVPPGMAASPAPVKGLPF